MEEQSINAKALDRIGTGILPAVHIGAFPAAHREEMTFWAAAHRSNAAHPSVVVRVMH